MISFEDCLPTSFEVTIIPLGISYLLFVLGLPLSIYIAMVGPLLYGLLFLFFLYGNLLHGISLRLLFAKLAFLFLCLSPAALTIAWKIWHSQ